MKSRIVAFVVVFLVAASACDPEPTPVPTSSTSTSLGSTTTTQRGCDDTPTPDGGDCPPPVFPVPCEEPLDAPPGSPSICTDPPVVVTG